MTPNRPFDHYRETEILSADPIQLVNLLYRGAIEAVGTARKHLASGAIRPRSKEIIKAWEILQELTRSLDHEQGRDFSQNLASLYTYMQGRLMEANSQQSDTQLKEVEGLLITLQEGWQQVSPSLAPKPTHQPISALG